MALPAQSAAADFTFELAQAVVDCVAGDSAALPRALTAAMKLADQKR